MKNTESKLSLNQFKGKLGKSKDLLQLIPGGIIGSKSPDVNDAENTADWLVLNFND